MPVHTVFVVDSVYFLFRSLVSWRNQETNHTGKDFGIIKVDFSKNAPLGKMVGAPPLGMVPIFPMKCCLAHFPILNWQEMTSSSACSLKYLGGVNGQQGFA